MDKLDKQIADASPEYQPNADFTQNTMQKIHDSQTYRKRTWFKPFAFSAAAALPLLAVVFIFAGINHNQTQKVSTTAKPVSTTSQQSTSKNVNSANAQTANEFDVAISQLDSEVSNYAISYSETSLDNINQ
ncbi:MAG: hypothetical protein WCK80_03840 [bacterium]